MRNQHGEPIGKAYKQSFKPVNRGEAKTSIKNDAFTLHENDYNATREKKIED